MNRRDAIRSLAATSALGALPFETLIKIGREVRASTAVTSFQTLNSHRAATLRAITEIILPRTDTPGAADAQVAEFIDMLMTGWMDADERDGVVAAIDEIDQRALADHGAGFVECNAQQQLALMTSLDTEVAELLTTERPAREHPLYRLKRLTMMGYFTSEPGMTETLRWSPFPGRWEPCMDIGEPS